MKIIIFTLSLFHLIVATHNCQNNIDYKFLDTLKIGNKTKIHNIIADTIHIKKKYGHTIITNIKIIDKRSEKFIQEIKDTSELGFSGGEIYLDDINLDDFNDIVLDLGAYNLNSTYYVWLYDKTKNNYSDYMVFNSAEELMPDSIFRTSTQSLGGRGGSSNSYKIIDGNFILIEEHNHSNDGYSGEYENTFYENEKMKLRVSGFYIWDVLNESPLTNDTVIVEVFRNQDEILHVEKKIWLIYKYEDSDKIKEDLYSKKVENDVLNYVKKEQYSYNKIGNNVIDTIKFNYVNNNWVQVK